MVTATIAGMGTLSTKKKMDGGEGEGGEDGALAGGAWATSNGEAGPESIEAEDTLFLKELRSRAQVRSIYIYEVLQYIYRSIYTCI